MVLDSMNQERCVKNQHSHPPMCAHQPPNTPPFCSRMILQAAFEAQRLQGGMTFWEAVSYVVVYTIIFIMASVYYGNRLYIKISVPPNSNMKVLY